MSNNCINFLLENLECITSSCIRAEEERKIFEINTQNRSNYYRIRIDNCMIKSQETKKCDYLFIEIKKPCLVFVEFKGDDINIAYEQICQTLDFFIKDNPNFKKIPHKRAYIISSSINKEKNNDFQNKAKELKKKYGISLDRKTNKHIANENELFK